MNNININLNPDRFTGFSDTYDAARPAMPVFPVEVIEKYLGRQAENVIDLGCGTGLSTLVWKNRCDNAIGVEPSDDMRKEAEKKQGGNICFMKGYSHEIPVGDAFADAVVCSQSFHWMEPVATFKEVSRVLKGGGVFATVDCDWPPVCDWQTEKAYSELFKKVKKIEAEHPDVKDTFVRYSKDKHLENIRNSGHFTYVREIVFSNSEKCTAARMVNLAYSQGSLQTILKKAPELIENELENFKKFVFDFYGDREFEIRFSYRMRIGVK
ncbi:MAG: methyltransferase domain-containing protein [Clostridia bacterium]|nr:methyltransferase domain-containing protein [Clostridia bacterium]